EVRREDVPRDVRDGRGEYSCATVKSPGPECRRGGTESGRAVARASEADGDYRTPPPPPAVAARDRTSERARTDPNSVPIGCVRSWQATVGQRLPHGLRRHPHGHQGFFLTSAGDCLAVPRSAAARDLSRTKPTLTARSVSSIMWFPQRQTPTGRAEL